MRHISMPIFRYSFLRVNLDLSCSLVLTNRMLWKWWCHSYCLASVDCSLQFLLSMWFPRQEYSDRISKSWEVYSFHLSLLKLLFLGLSVLRCSFRELSFHAIRSPNPKEWPSINILIDHPSSEWSQKPALAVKHVSEVLNAQPRWVYK